MIIDLWLTYQFIRRLATPFESWDAFKLGIIDAEGNILKKRKDLTTMAEKKAWGWFDLMLLKMKRLINKIPGGEGAKKLASYAAALWLIKEHNMFTDQATLTESASLSDSEVELMIQEFSRCYLDYTTSPATVNQIVEDGIVNVAGSGGIAGIGVGPDGEPGMSKANQKKHRQKNAGSVLRRKIAEELVKRQADPLKDHGIRKTVKRPKKPAEPTA